MPLLKTGKPAMNIEFNPFAGPTPFQTNANIVKNVSSKIKHTHAIALAILLTLVAGIGAYCAWGIRQARINRRSESGKVDMIRSDHFETEKKEATFHYVAQCAYPNYLKNDQILKWINKSKLPPANYLIFAHNGMRTPEGNELEREVFNYIKNNKDKLDLNLPMAVVCVFYNSTKVRNSFVLDQLFKCPAIPLEIQHTFKQSSPPELKGCSDEDLQEFINLLKRTPALPEQEYVTSRLKNPLYLDSDTTP